MKGLIFDIRSFSVHDGPGIRTTVFLKGCPLRCAWCHNPESFSCEPEKALRVQKLGDTSYTVQETIGSWMHPEDIVARFEADRPFFEESGGGITISGGEPLFQPEFTLDILKKTTAKGIHSAIDTSGYAPEALFKQTIAVTDLVLFDLKLADGQRHKEFTGQDNGLIMANLSHLAKSKKTFFIRIPLIPEVTDTTENLHGLKKILLSLPVIERIDLLPFHHLAQDKYKRLGLNYGIGATKAYDKNRVEEIKNFFADAASTVSVGG
ncbi:MAG: glycyl-radical enzyme activating protein [Bacteroidales bacterium]|nr:glycyl-radical enzyme activating protein [Bacteroidales bacterium]